MMVQASTHMGISVSMCGWAFLLGHRTIVTLHHLPLPHLPPNIYHLHLPLCHPRESCITLLSNGNNPPGIPWPPQGHRGPIFQRHRKVKMKVRHRHCQATMREQFRAHLFALTIASLKAGCRVESSLRNRHHSHHAQFTALQGTHGNPWSNQVHFDSDSFPNSVANHALYCYVNSPHLMDDLVLSNKGSVDGITDGLPIKGKGTFKFTIKDNSGRRHNICIPESLYIPGIKK
jgi:hypothetical protein